MVALDWKKVEHFTYGLENITQPNFEKFKKIHFFVLFLFDSEYDPLYDRALISESGANKTKN